MTLNKQMGVLVVVLALVSLASAAVTELSLERAC